MEDEIHAEQDPGPERVAGAARLQPALGTVERQEVGLLLVATLALAVPRYERATSLAVHL
jgi:hypothetical protein